VRESFLELEIIKSGSRDSQEIDNGFSTEKSKLNHFTCFNEDCEEIISQNQ
jgi:hypothetical protein